MRTSILLLILAAVAAQGGTLQRRTAAEIEAGAVNAPGEATYSVEDGAAVLRIGTSDAGTLVVSDPYAVHFAPRRALARTEYSITLSPGAQWLPDGSINMATNVTGTAVVTNIVVVETTGAALANVEYTYTGQGATIRQTRLDDTHVQIRSTTQTGVIGGAGMPGYCILSPIRAYAWSSDKRDAVWDANADRVTLRDGIGSVDMADLRGWIVRRYDPATADHWAQHPATQDVRLDGNALHADHGRLLRIQGGRIEGGARLDISAGGTAVVSIDAPLSGPSADLDILDFSIETNGTATIVVDGALGVQPSIQTRQSLDSGNWTTLSGATVTQGQFDGRQCYIITFAVGNASSAFYRAVATVPGDAVARALRIHDCELYIDGRKATWKQITVSGQTFRVLSAD